MGKLLKLIHQLEHSSLRQDYPQLQVAYRQLKQIEQQGERDKPGIVLRQQPLLIAIIHSLIRANNGKALDPATLQALSSLLSKELSIADETLATWLANANIDINNDNPVVTHAIAILSTILGRQLFLSKLSTFELGQLRYAYGQLRDLLIGQEKYQFFCKEMDSLCDPNPSTPFLWVQYLAGFFVGEAAHTLEGSLFDLRYQYGVDAPEEKLNVIDLPQLIHTTRHTLFQQLTTHATPALSKPLAQSHQSQGQPFEINREDPPQVIAIKKIFNALYSLEQLSRHYQQGVGWGNISTMATELRTVYRLLSELAPELHSLFQHSLEHIQRLYQKGCALMPEYQQIHTPSKDELSELPSLALGATHDLLAPTQAPSLFDVMQKMDLAPRIANHYVAAISPESAKPVHHYELSEQQLTDMHGFVSALLFSAKSNTSDKDARKVHGLVGLVTYLRQLKSNSTILADQLWPILENIYQNLPKLICLFDSLEQTALLKPNSVVEQFKHLLLSLTQQAKQQAKAGNHSSIVTAISRVEALSEQTVSNTRLYHYRKQNSYQQHLARLDEIAQYQYVDKGLSSLVTRLQSMEAASERLTDDMIVAIKNKLQDDQPLLLSLSPKLFDLLTTDNPHAVILAKIKAARKQLATRIASNHFMINVLTTFTRELDNNAVTLLEPFPAELLRPPLEIHTLAAAQTELLHLEDDGADCQYMLDIIKQIQTGEAEEKWMLDNFRYLYGKIQGLIVAHLDSSNELDKTLDEKIVARVEGQEQLPKEKRLQRIVSIINERIIPYCIKRKELAQNTIAAPPLQVISKHYQQTTPTSLWDVIQKIQTAKLSTHFSALTKAMALHLTRDYPETLTRLSSEDKPPYAERYDESDVIHALKALTNGLHGLSLAWKAFEQVGSHLDAGAAMVNINLAIGQLTAVYQNNHTLLSTETAVFGKLLAQLQQGLSHFIAQGNVDHIKHIAHETAITMNLVFRHYKGRLDLDEHNRERQHRREPSVDLPNEPAPAKLSEHDLGLSKVAQRSLQAMGVSDYISQLIGPSLVKIKDIIVAKASDYERAVSACNAYYQMAYANIYNLILEKEAMYGLKPGSLHKVVMDELDRLLMTALTHSQFDRNALINASQFPALEQTLAQRKLSKARLQEEYQHLKATNLLTTPQNIRMTAQLEAIDRQITQLSEKRPAIEAAYKIQMIKIEIKTRIKPPIFLQSDLKETLLHDDIRLSYQKFLYQKVLSSPQIQSLCEQINEGQEVSDIAIAETIETINRQCITPFTKIDRCMQFLEDLAPVIEYYLKNYQSSDMGEEALEELQENATAVKEILKGDLSLEKKIVSIESFVTNNENTTDKLCSFNQKMKYHWHRFKLWFSNYHLFRENEESPTGVSEKRGQLSRGYGTFFRPAPEERIAQEREPKMEPLKLE